MRAQLEEIAIQRWRDLPKRPQGREMTEPRFRRNFRLTSYDLSLRPAVPRLWDFKDWTYFRVNLSDYVHLPSFNFYQVRSLKQNNHCWCHHFIKIEHFNVKNFKGYNFRIKDSFFFTLSTFKCILKTDQPSVVFIFFIPLKSHLNVDPGYVTSYELTFLCLYFWVSFM